MLLNQYIQHDWNEHDIWIFNYTNNQNFLNNRIFLNNNLSLHHSKKNNKYHQ